MTLDRPAALIFDWDNTLVDSWGTIHAAMNVMFARMGHEPWSLAETQLKVRKSLRDAFPAMFGDRWEEARDRYLTAFEALHIERLSPLPDAEALIQAIAAEGHYLALVSNKTGKESRSDLRTLSCVSAMVQGAWPIWPNMMLSAAWIVPQLSTSVLSQSKISADGRVRLMPAFRRSRPCAPDIFRASRARRSRVCRCR